MKLYTKIAILCLLVQFSFQSEEEFNCPGCCSIGQEADKTICDCPEICNCRSKSFCECPNNCACEGNECVGK